MTKTWELLDRLEKDQDDLEAQREALRPKYAAFREGLFQALHAFCTEAQQRGLTGIEEPIRVANPDEDDLEIVVTLNGLDLRLVASSEFVLDPSRAEWPGRQLDGQGLEAYAAPSPSFRIYVYPDAGDESMPYAYIQILSLGTDACEYHLWHFTENGEMHPLVDGLEVDAAAGRCAARALIEYSYSSKATWPSRPTLGEARGLARGKRTGFPTIE
jgi:hypothetical protein